MQFDLNQADKDRINYIWKKVQVKIKDSAQRIGSGIPYIAKNHRYQDVGEQNMNWWTNGFWCGFLWQMYHATNENFYLKLARQVEKRLDCAFEKSTQLDHDVGFVWLNSAIADFKLTNSKDALNRGLKATEILASRFNPIGQYLLAWNGEDKQGQIIVDCFMNLPLLYWGTQITKDDRYQAIAEKHTVTATRYLIRADGTVNHIAVFDQCTGEFKGNLGGQGYGLNSSWSRGQAWGIYGQAIAYRETHQSQYLNNAKKIANSFIANVSINDFVSVIDFRTPKDAPNYTDTTATAIAICSILELIEYLPINEREFYKKAALNMFYSLTNRFVDFDPQHDELLNGGSAKYHRAGDREVAIIYGDAFYLEALLRFLDLNLKIY